MNIHINHSIYCLRPSLWQQCYRSIVSPRCSIETDRGRGLCVQIKSNILLYTNPRPKRPGVFYLHIFILFISPFGLIGKSPGLGPGRCSFESSGGDQLQWKRARVRFIGTVLKTVGSEKGPWVQIPPLLPKETL